MEIIIEHDWKYTERVHKVYKVVQFVCTVEKKNFK